MKLFGLKFDSIVMNASGPKCTEFEDLKHLALSDTCAVVTKSSTILPRKGNEKPNYNSDFFGAIQSMGLPNPGYKIMAERILKLRKITNKPIIVSVAGFSKEEYVLMSKHFEKNKADMIELNLSCPNIAGKEQAAYDPIQTREIIKAVKNEVNLPISVKLPCYPDVVLQEKIASVLLDLKIDCITAINSIGNSLILKNQRPIIKPKFGGLCGSYIRPVALGTVHRFYNLFDEEIKIIGVGGISVKEDIEDFQSVGADLVQIGTAYEQEGDNIFTRLMFK